MKLHRSRRILEQAHGAVHPELARVLGKIGDTYIDEGDHPTALRYYRRVLSIHTEVYGSEDPTTLAAARTVESLSPALP